MNISELYKPPKSTQTKQVSVSKLICLMLSIMAMIVGSMVFIVNALEITSHSMRLGTALQFFGGFGAVVIGTAYILFTHQDVSSKVSHDR